MNNIEYLLLCLAEEATEVAQRVSKAMRFTLNEVQPGQDLTNSHRITHELIDLIAVMEMLIEIEAIEDPLKFRDGIEIKKAKVREYAGYSRKVGTLHDELARTPALPVGAVDWTEDLTHENGNYQCKCSECGCSFQGHKRRVLCKRCALPPCPDTEQSPEAASSVGYIPPPNLIKVCIAEINRIASMTPEEMDKQNDVGFLELLDMSLTLIAALSGDQGEADIEPATPDMVKRTEIVNQALSRMGDAAIRKDAERNGHGPEVCVSNPSPATDWLPHNGRECPVPGDTRVKVQRKNKPNWVFEDLASNFNWKHVKAYRIVKPGGGAV